VWRQAASVGGLTLVSRLFGFLRDMMMAAILGAGPLADAFMIAFRLPNHFRTIFAEGAFNAAFVPRYAGALEAEGTRAARDFAGSILGWTLLIHAVVLALALVGTPVLVSVLAPGFTDDPAQFALTVSLTRITFPYLFLISVMTLGAGMLNAHGRFAAAAGASILLNICMMAGLALASFFPTAAHALAWGVLASGFAQLGLILWDLRRGHIPLKLRRPRFNKPVADFARGFLPAVLGSAGTQIAMFADTIIASFLPQGSVSFLYYAERLYQLPVAVIGIAIGTVLLPDLSRRLAGGDHDGASHSFNRAVEGSVILALPFVVLFMIDPAPVLAVLFGRGAFDAHAIAGSASALAAYSAGLLAVVLLRPVTSAFYARKDTTTPVIALGIATIINVALKIALVGTWLHAGLALATAVGAWINLGVLLFLIHRRGILTFDARLGRMLLFCLAGATGAAVVLVLLAAPSEALRGLLPVDPELAPLALRALGAAVLYFGVVGLAWRFGRTRIAG